MVEFLPVEIGGSLLGISVRVVFSSPASGILSPPSNIPKTATEYFVPALREKEKVVNLHQSLTILIR